jgi:hypothetical protein
VKFYCFLHWFEDQSKVVGVSNVVNVKLVPPSLKHLKKKLLLVMVHKKKAKVVQSSKVVSNSAMENLTVLSPQQMLQGQAAGVQVVQSSGLLGGATVVKEVMLYYSWW